MGNLTRVTSGAGVLSLEDAKAWFRVISSREDSLIKALAVAAQDQVEDYTGLSLSESTFIASYDRWPDFQLTRNQVNDTIFPAFGRQLPARSIILPRCPLFDVVSVTYTDVDGEVGTVDSANYAFAMGSRPSVMSFSQDFDFPELFEGAATDRVFIRFKAKIPDSESAMLEVAKVAVRYTALHWYNNRSSVVVGASVNPMPGTAKDLLRSLRIDRPFN